MSGTVVATYDYDAFGNHIATTGSVVNPYRYAGYRWDAETGLYYLNARKQVNNNSYDQANNQTESTDAYTQTSASRYLPNGNIDYETGLISAGENIVSNSSAQRDANLDNWPDDWSRYGSATFSWATTAKYGNRSLGIGNATSWADIINFASPILYNSNQTYVLSGYIKTSSLSANAAFLTAYAYDINGNWIGEINSTRIGGTTDWTKVQLILGSHNVPAGTHSIYAGVTRTPSTGTSWFDAIQLEVGSIESAYNLVENASFEKGGSVPAQWIANFTPVTGEGRVTNFKHAGNASFKINGQAGVNKFIRQRINVSGDQNSRYTLSGWSYADNPNPNGGYYGLQVAINHTDGTVDWSFANDFSKVNHADMGWEHVVAEIKPTKSFSQDFVKVVS